METFYTVQGEGFYSGRAAFFIRIAGCDVGCVWCDVKESWDRNDHEIFKVSDLITQVKESNTDFVVITGGEPAMYDLTFLTQELHKLEVEIAIETSGAYELVGDFDWICLSPKKFKKPVDSVIKQAQELKIVVFNKSDLEWAESYAEQVSADCNLYLQAEWGKKEKMYDLILDYITRNTQWRISVQTHKYLG
ncbi:MAG: 7-carboxy-7-deazaguanine synthase QueE, partial [Flavobacteriales bacterium]